MEESAKLAESTAILLNVSEFEDATQASEALISTMQAFSYTADESQHVVDILNEVGNNFAVSSDGLATALQDSASALMEGGNNLEQSVALIAAANRVIQDPDSVGAALRTISLRLRGTSTEILEEMGEETEGAVESVSKLQEKLKALTGVDILTDTGSYKDTYTILKEIGEVWSELDDMSKAGALELMAGKNRANTLSAILSNMKDLEGAYESAMNANGSALKENATYMDSIQGRIDIFNNSLQTMWMNFINTDAVKFVVDLGTALVEAADSMGVLSVAAGGFAGWKSAIGSITDELKELKDNPTKAINFFGEDSIFKSRNKVTKAIKKQKESLEDLTKVQQSASTTTQKIYRANKQEQQSVKDVVKTSKQRNTAYKQVIVSKLKQKAATEASTGAKRQEVVETNKLTLAEKANLAVTKALTVAKNAAKGILIGMAVSAFTSLVTNAISSIIDANEDMEELIDNAIDSAEELKDTRDDIEDYKEEVDSLRAILDSNTSSEQEAYDARAKLIEIQNELIDKFGAEAKGINLVTGELQKQKAELDGLAKSAAEEWLWDSDNVVAYQNAIAEMNKLHTTDFVFFNRDVTSKLETDENGMTAHKTSITKQTTGVDTDQKIVDEYIKGMTEIAEKYGGKIDDSASPNSTGQFSTTEVMSGYKMASFTGMTVEQIDEMYSEFQEFVDYFADEYGVNLEDVKKTLSQGKSQRVTDDYLQHRQVYDEMRKNKALTAYADENAAVLAAKESYYSATTDQERLDALRNYYDQVDIAAAEAARKQEDYMEDYYLDMKNMELEEYELRIKVNEDGLGTQIEDIVTNSGLSALDDSQLKDMFDRKLYEEGAIDESGQYSSDQIAGFQQLKAEADEAGISVLDLISILGRLGYINIRPEDIIDSEPVIKAVKAYSELSDAIDKLNAAEETANELSFVGAKASEDYYNSLTELGIATDDLSKCIDKNNDYVVTNAAELQRLIKVQKEELAAEVKLAKAKEQSNYRELVRSLDDQIGSAMTLADVNEEVTDSLLSQIRAVKSSINQYDQLEKTLLGTANAFDEFSKAKEADSKNTYGDQYVEMVQTMYDAIYKTGEVGTEAFWAAVRANVPDDIYSHLAPGEDQINAIAEHLNENVFSTLTFDADSFSIDYSDVEKFVEKAQDAGVFTGTDAKSFGLSEVFMSNLAEGEDALKAFADKMDMTVTQVYSMLMEMNNYNADGIGLSIFQQLDNSTAGQITLLNNEYERLLTQRKALLDRGADELTLQTNLDEIYKVESGLASLEQQAMDSVTAYALVDNALVDTSKKLNEVLPDEIITTLGLNGEETVQENLQALKDYLLNFEEPTVVELDIAQEKLQEEIANLEKQDATISAHVELNKDGLYEIVNEDEYKGEVDLEHYVQLKNIGEFINVSLAEDLTTTETLLSEIAKNTAIMAGVESGSTGVEVASENNSNSGPSTTSGTVELEQGEIELPATIVIDEEEVTEEVSNVYDAILGRLSELDPETMIPADELNSLGFGQIAEEAWSAADAVAYFTKIKNQATVTGTTGGLIDVTETKEGIATYSELQSQVSSFNELLNQTDEIMGNNTEVTQGYYDSLKELCETQEELDELNEAFYKGNNKLVVKNSKVINKLVKEKKKELATDVKLAKGQSQLEYYDLVGQLNSVLGATNELTDGNRDAINSLLSQIDTVQSTIYQYQLLEDQLLGTTNAFKEYKEAQEIDNLNTYGDDYVSMAQTMYDAFYKTGEVGTEANWEAIQALVPPEVYQHLKDEGDQLKAIYDYFNKNILPTLTLKDDQFSLDYDAIENFVEKGIANDVFVKDTTGDGKTNLDLVEGMNLEEAARLMGMTETQAYAMFAALDKFNFNGSGPSFLEMLDDSLSGDIMEITSNIEELNREKLALLEGGVTEEEQARINEINTLLGQSEQELKNLGATAYSTWQEYTQVDGALAALGEVEDKSQIVSEVFDKDMIMSLGLTGNETVQEAYDLLLAKQLELGVPTVLTATLAIENIDTQITELETALNNNDFSNVDPVSVGLEVGEAPTKEDVEAKLAALKEDKAVIATTFNIELTEEEKADLQKELESIEQFKINDKEFTVTGNTSMTMIKLRAVKDAVDKIKSKEVEIKTKYTSTGTPPSGSHDVNGTAHAQGTAFKGGSWGAPRTETALVGELGPELVVRGNKWSLVGENGAEFTGIRKGDIIFNHKQTEDLLKNGYVTGRGKAYAEGTIGGTAYALWEPTSPDKSLSNTAGSEISNASSKLSKAAEDISTASDKLSDDFKEVFDWIEVRIEEITESLDLKGAKLENAVGSTKQNAIIDDMIDLNQKLYDNLTAGASKYYEYAKKLLAKVPAEYRTAAQDGSIAIESFVGTVGQSTLEAIQDYREWVQKGADLTQQAEETLTEISTLAKQSIDNIAADYENQKSLRDIKIEQYEAYNALLETDVGYESEKLYQAMMKETNDNIKTITEQRNKMQAELDKRVKSGEIKRESQDWYDAINDIAAVDAQIIELQTDTENWQDSINELYWDKLDDLMSRLDAVSDETENLIDILGNKDAVDEAGEWTKEGITQLGLYAQQMEVAEMQAKKYEEEIGYLNKNWKELGYTEREYVEKLEELKSAQYDSIQAYHSAKDAIVDLNSERVEAIKEGIQKEIDAYSELIEKQKELLSAEKDLYDFQKNIKGQQKEIADIERQLAALAGDNSASARAQRAQLQAQLAEQKQELEDTYYDRSISKQQEALDKELEDFQETKDKEIENWEEYLENTEQVVSDSLSTIQSNTDSVYQTLKELGEEYGLSITEALTSPWKEGEYAIQSYTEKFKLNMSATVEELQALEAEFNDTIANIGNKGTSSAAAVDKNSTNYQAATKKTSSSSSNGSNKNNSTTSSSSDSYPYGKASETKGVIKRGSQGNDVKAIQYALNKLGFGNSGTQSVDGIFGSGTEQAVKAFQKAMGISADGAVGPDTRAKFKLKKYASGTTGVKKDQWAIIDENQLEEIVLHAQGGKLTYLTKGSSVIPSDISENLMKLGQLDPSAILDQNKPSIGMHPEIHNTEINLNIQYGDMVSIGEFHGDNPEDIAKIVAKQFEKHTKDLNNALKRYTR